MHSTQTNTSKSEPETAPAAEAGLRRKSNVAQSTHHVTPRPLLDPIREVKRESIHWKRKVFHVMGIGAAGFTYAYAPVSAVQALVILGIFGAIFVTLDALRFFVPSLNKKVKRDFAPFMRDYELDGLSGSSWFFFSVLISIALFPKIAAAIGIIYLAVGDPLASFVGVRWGKTKLPGGKSLEGSLALAVLCSVVGTIVLITAENLPVGSAILVATVSGITAAVAEWLPIKKIDDNFTVPILTGALATLMLGLVTV
jgi:diacylglycerol kinase (CTP)